MKFSFFLFRAQTVFTVACLQVYYREGQNKYFLWKFETSYQYFVNFQVLLLTYTQRRTMIPQPQLSFNVLIRFSYTVLFALVKTSKLLLLLAICSDFSESSQGRNWNFSIKPVYLLLSTSEGTIPMLSLYITQILVLKSIILVLCQWYQLKECRLRKLISES